MRTSDKRVALYAIGHWIALRPVRHKASTLCAPFRGPKNSVGGGLRIRAEKVEEWTRGFEGILSKEPLRNPNPWKIVCSRRMRMSEVGVPEHFRNFRRAFYKI